MHMIGCVYVWNFGTKFFLRRGECKTRENSNFSQKRQNRKFGENPEFSKPRMTKRTSPLKSSSEI